MEWLRVGQGELVPRRSGEWASRAIDSLVGYPELLLATEVQLLIGCDRLHPERRSLPMGYRSPRPHVFSIFPSLTNARKRQVSGVEHRLPQIRRIPAGVVKRDGSWFRRFGRIVPRFAVRSPVATSHSDTLAERFGHGFYRPEPVK